MNEFLLIMALPAIAITPALMLGLLLERLAEFISDMLP
jgi:hypothetical protein